jgi:tubulin polyglutamylase TTLL6/13
MRIYIHEKGIARFATEAYIAPRPSNIDNMFIHLTNYAINKYNSAF